MLKGYRHVPLNQNDDEVEHTECFKVGCVDAVGDIIALLRRYPNTALNKLREYTILN